jgi:hypothetical protein
LEDLTEFKYKVKRMAKNPIEAMPLGGEVGPGAYDPDISVVKKRPPACGWGSYKTNRIPTVPK